MVISCCSPDDQPSAKGCPPHFFPLQQRIHLFWLFLLLQLGKLRQRLGKSWGQQMLWTWAFQGQVELGALRTGSGMLDLALRQREGRGHLFISFPVLLTVVWKSTQLLWKQGPPSGDTQTSLGLPVYVLPMLLFPQYLHHSTCCKVIPGSCFCAKYCWVNVLLALCHIRCLLCTLY